MIIFFSLNLAADAANITLLDDLDSLFEQGDAHRRFER